MTNNSVCNICQTAPKKSWCQAAFGCAHLTDGILWFHHRLQTYLKSPTSWLQAASGSLFARSAHCSCQNSACYSAQASDAAFVMMDRLFCNDRTKALKQRFALSLCLCAPLVDCPWCVLPEPENVHVTCMNLDQEFVRGRNLFVDFTMHPKRHNFILHRWHHDCGWLELLCKEFCRPFIKQIQKGCCKAVGPRQCHISNAREWISQKYTLDKLWLLTSQTSSHRAAQRPAKEHNLCRIIYFL